MTDHLPHSSYGPTTPNFDACPIDGHLGESRHNRATLGTILSTVKGHANEKVTGV